VLTVRLAAGASGWAPHQRNVQIFTGPIVLIGGM
jgi:hypothetical protein